MEKYIEAIQTGNWKVMHEAGKKEASRQVGLMDRWLKDARKIQSADLRDFPFLAENIEKAVNYRSGIYNRNKKLKEIDADLVRLDNLLKDIDTPAEDIPVHTEKAKELLGDKADIEFEQYTLAGRILKIYFAVNMYVVLVQEKTDYAEGTGND
jgi:hypothetical protein